MRERSSGGSKRAEAARRVAWRRAIAVSALGHAAAAAALIFAPSPRRALPALPILHVDLVTAAAVAALPTPPRRAQPTPRQPAKPPRPPPRRDRVILPTEPRRDESPPEPRASPPAQPPPPPDDPEYEDVLAELRRELGVSEPPPAPRREERPSRPVRGREGDPALSRETAAWLLRARERVNQTWVLPLGFRATSLEVEVAVQLDAEGQLLGTPRIVRRSGNPWYDRGVVRAIEKADPLPPPPEAGEWPFIFRPEDLP